MIVHVRLFAAFREAAGARDLDLDLPEGATAAEALEALRTIHPAVDRLVRQTVFAVNEEYVDGRTALHAGDELVFIPPVSGG